MTRYLAPLTALVVLLLFAAPAPAQAQGRDWQATAATAPNPLLGVRFYVDWWEQPSARWYKRYQRRGKHGSAALMYELASQPIFRWIGKSDRNPERNTRVFLQRAAERAPGSVPGITVLAHHGESCKRGYTGGGRKLDARYRRWFKRFVRGLRNHRAIVVLEPDGLGTLKCLRGSRRLSRLRNMRFATQLLAKKPNVTTYIDGGASDWRPAREMARYLRASGISRVRGFALNVTHFDTNANNFRYGLRISRMLGGKHFVINTDENGRGRVWYRRWISRARNLWRTVNVWCNPKRSGLGTRPQAVNHPVLDGYLWMSRPGASAGSCRNWNPRYSMRGGPKAGSFWPKRALSLARQSNP
jgi:endoglucanase